MERAKAAGFTEEEIKELRKKQIAVHAAIAAWEEMQEQGITRADLENINQNERDFGDIILIWNGIETEDDRILVTGLIKGDYETAFTASPSQISRDTQLFFSE